MTMKASEVLDACEQALKNEKLQCVVDHPNSLVRYYQPNGVCCAIGAYLGPEVQDIENWRYCSSIDSLFDDEIYTPDTDLDQEIIIKLQEVHDRLIKSPDAKSYMQAAINYLRTCETTDEVYDL